MPKAGSTSATPNLSRPLAVDLRSKVIGTNVLIDRLTQEITRLVEAQQAMLRALTDLAVKQTHPPVTAAMDMNREVSRSWAAERAGTLADVTRGMMPDLPPVPLVRPVDWAKAIERYGSVSPSAALPGSIDEVYPADEPHEGTGDIHSLMAEELAEYEEDEKELPPPPSDNRALWERRMTSWRGSRLWMPSWGPRPGQEGCQAPRDMIGNGRR